MAKTRDELLTLLNGPRGLENLKALLATESLPPEGRDVNNHIHTTYSFSPYSPTAAVWFARAAGLCTCGLMDHDSIAGAEEFLPRRRPRTWAPPSAWSAAPASRTPPSATAS